LLELLRTQFPAEEAVLGTRPEGFARVVHRVFRWDARLLLGLLRRFGRPVFRFYVAEEDGAVAATTLVTFGKETGYVSMVVVDPAYRHRGFARGLLEAARQATVARGKPYLALDVLATNEPARRLYESLGYRPLRSATYYVHDRPADLSRDARTVRGLRAFRKEDAGPLAEVARQEKPAEVEAVLPTTSREILGSAWAARVFELAQAAWVIDEGAGPIGWVSASVPLATEAGHVAAPILGPSVAPETAQALVETAGAWCAEHRAPRLTVVVPTENRRGRAAVEAVGFRNVFPLWTLYRPSA
jgi:ribosomal protein S18 acetylase RimI-like enzyme